MEPETNTSLPDNNMPIMNPSPMPGQESKSVGPLIGVIVIIAVIVLGGLYFWGQRLDEQKQSEAALQNDAATQELETQNTSDEVADIEADLNATNLEGLDTEMNQLETEINTSL